MGARAARPQLLATIVLRSGRAARAPIRVLRGALVEAPILLISPPGVVQGRLTTDQERGKVPVRFSMTKGLPDELMNSVPRPHALLTGSHL
jgi:hypothetical protein